MGEGVEGGDGFDEAGDGEGVEDPAGEADQVERAAIAAERDGHADERGDAGAVNLRDAVEVDDDSSSAAFENGIESGGELVAGVADGEAAVYVKDDDVAFAVQVDFDGSVLGHDLPLGIIRYPPGFVRQTLKSGGGTNKQMRLALRHEWDVNTEEARRIQDELREKWEGQDRLGAVRTVAGLDAAFVIKGSQALKARRGRWAALRAANRAIAGVVVYRYPEIEELERVHAEVRLEFPYVPGFLSFREIPALLAALMKLRRMPDLLFCDGQGCAHPRRMGLATHLGILLDRPTIGCAKSILIGKHGRVRREKGAWSPLVEGGETIGAALRTRTGVKPVYVSQGHRVSLETAIRMTLEVSDGVRIPRPTREADRFVSELKSNRLRK